MSTQVTPTGMMLCRIILMMFRVNREIIQTMVHAYSRIFGNLKPVFDGRSNLYVKDPLPIGNDQVELEVTLDSEGKDRVFRVTIKWVAQVTAAVQLRFYD